MKQTNLKRSETFRLQDHLYEFKLDIPPNFEFILESFLAFLLEGFTNAFKRLQSQYEEKSDEYAEVFVVFKDTNIKDRQGEETENSSNLEHVYNSGHYYLFQDASEIAKEMLDRMGKYFQSNKQFILDDGFYLSMTVVHFKHSTHRARNIPNYSPPKTVGALTDYHFQKSSHNYFEVPSKFSEKKWCLPGCLLFAKCRFQKLSWQYLKNLGPKRTVFQEKEFLNLENDYYRLLFYKIQKLSDSSPQRRFAAEKTFLEETVKMLRFLNLENRKNFEYDTDGQIFADFLRLQIYVYKRQGNHKVYQYPEKRDISRPSCLLYYYEPKGKEEIGHIGLILKNNFFKNAYECCYCNKRLSHCQKIHKCQNSCRSCRGYIVDEEEEKKPIYFSDVTMSHLCFQKKQGLVKHYFYCENAMPDVRLKIA